MEKRARCMSFLVGLPDYQACMSQNVVIYRNDVMFEDIRLLFFLARLLETKIFLADWHFFLSFFSLIIFAVRSGFSGFRVVKGCDEFNNRRNKCANLECKRVVFLCFPVLLAAIICNVLEIPTSSCLCPLILSLMFVSRILWSVFKNSTNVLHFEDVEGVNPSSGPVTGCFSSGVISRKAQWSFLFVTQEIRRFFFSWCRSGFVTCEFLLPEQKVMNPIYVKGS